MQIENTRSRSISKHPNVPMAVAQQLLLMRLLFFGNYHHRQQKQRGRDQRNDAPGLPHFHIRCVDPGVRQIAFDRSIQKRINALIYFFA